MKDPIATAADILRQHWNGTLPVNPGQIARALGVRLQHNQPHNSYSASLLTDPHNHPVISYNQQDTSIRRRFAVAHALGHFVLKHNNMPPDTVASFSTSIGHPHEHAANEFAMALLIPQSELKTLARSGALNENELALVFGVSTYAVCEKISRLPAEIYSDPSDPIKGVVDDVGTAVSIVAEVAAFKLLV